MNYLEMTQRVFDKASLLAAKEHNCDVDNIGSVEIDFNPNITVVSSGLKDNGLDDLMFSAEDLEKECPYVDSNGFIFKASDGKDYWCKKEDDGSVWMYYWNEGQQNWVTKHKATEDEILKCRSSRVELDIAITYMDKQEAFFKRLGPDFKWKWGTFYHTLSL